MFSAAVHGYRLSALTESRRIFIFKRVIRLFFIQLFAGIAVALAIYFPGLDLALAFLYFLVVGVEALRYQGNTWRSILVTVLVWQLPGFLLSLQSIAPAGIWGEANYGFFVLQFWYTPLIPLLSCLAGYVILGKPMYYYVLLGAPLLLGLYYCLVAALGRRAGLKRSF